MDVVPQVLIVAISVIQHTPYLFVGFQISPVRKNTINLLNPTGYLM
jgi:hypothetical protein